ncbi:hypothetical protein [Xylanimonas ulmi]|uniref:Uncharacterized protein n=1 Tax=Xylanimonas ulmi TaxID=228973 RepID=A0A4Q7M6G6_9MICO|nr:hypothetical protein [Xylanibacterium ulmi]RZS63091.1 hypothetical protein EV386_3449 [Xylanibacterium ulmi]
MRARAKGCGGDERGAGALEYVGVVALVVAVCLALLMRSTAIGQTLAAKLCEAVGGSCATAASPVPPAERATPPSHPCTVSTAVRKAQGSVSVSFVRLGGGVGMTIEERSDGTFVVTLHGDGSLGASLSAGEVRGKLRILGQGGAVGANASVGVDERLAVGAEYTFASSQEAADFQEWAYRQFGKDAAKGVGALTGPLLSPSIGFAVEAGALVYDRLTGYDYQPPAPSAVSVSGELSGRGAVQAGGAEAGATLSSALGARQDMRTGETTFYNKVSLSAEAAVSLGLNVGGHSKGAVALVMAVTLDKDNVLTSVGLNGLATADGAYDLSGLAPVPLEALRGSGGAGLNLRAEFDVTDANRAQTWSTLADLGLVATTGPAGPGLAQAAAMQWIVREARAGGDITAQTLDVSSQDLLDAAVGVKAPLVGGVGVGVGGETASRTSTGAWYLGDHGWKRWEACR